MGRIGTPAAFPNSRSAPTHRRFDTLAISRYNAGIAYPPGGIAYPPGGIAYPPGD